MDIQKDSWIWVIIQDPGGNETLLGQYDSENDLSFIPAFFDKQDAQDCVGLIKMERDKKYELNAMQYGLLLEHATQNQFMIFFLNSKGEIKEKIDPSSVIS